MDRLVDTLFCKLANNLTAKLLSNQNLSSTIHNRDYDRDDNDLGQNHHHKSVSTEMNAQQFAPNHKPSALSGLESDYNSIESDMNIKQEVIDNCNDNDQPDLYNENSFGFTTTSIKKEQNDDDNPNDDLKLNEQIKPSDSKQTNGSSSLDNQEDVQIVEEEEEEEEYEELLDDDGLEDCGCFDCVGFAGVQNDRGQGSLGQGYLVQECSNQGQEQVPFPTENLPNEVVSTNRDDLLSFQALPTKRPRTENVDCNPTYFGSIQQEHKEDSSIHVHHHNRIHPNHHHPQVQGQGIHTQNDRPKHFCTFANCTKVFSRSFLLKIHRRTHLRIKPYRCKWPGCSYASEQRPNALTHIRMIHFNLPRTGGGGGGVTTDPREFLQVVQELL